MQTRPSLPETIAAGRSVVLDGGLATLLERHGHDLTSQLWSARLLQDDPSAIERAHREFFAAGAEVATTASYQASFDGFARAGIDRPQAVELIRASCRVADRARSAHEDDTGRPAWVAASVGPYGAALADGSEYRGDYGLSVQQLREWHRPRLEVLLEAVRDGSADVLAVETLPSAVEAEALLRELEGTGVPAWLSLTAVVDDRGRPVTRTGDPLGEVFAAASAVDEVFAVGVNCVDPAAVGALVGAGAGLGVPLICYPNSGELWDGAGRRWHGAPTISDALVTGWADSGAQLVGGCCRVGPELVATIAGSVRSEGGGITKG